jgi:hypothetical protein
MHFGHHRYHRRFYLDYRLRHRRLSKQHHRLH